MSPPKSFMETVMLQLEYCIYLSTALHTHWNSYCTIPDLYEQLKSPRKAGSQCYRWRCHAIQFKGLLLGFVLADDYVDANILVTCFGQLSGHDSLSFTSEICMCIPSSSEVCNNTYCRAVRKSEEKFQFYTDSLSMMKKLKAIDKYPDCITQHGTWLGMECSLSPAQSMHG